MSVEQPKDIKGLLVLNALPGSTREIVTRLRGILSEMIVVSELKTLRDNGEIEGVMTNGGRLTVWRKRG